MQCRGWLYMMLACAASSGCARYSHTPLFDPGTEQFQSKRAEVSDPYPDPEAAPDFLGSRPKGFTTPRTEPTEVQEFADPRYRPRPFNYRGRTPGYVSPALPPAIPPAGPAPGW